MAVLHTYYPRLYSDEPPPLQTKANDTPTLVVSWAATIFALVAILIRILGRWVRTETLFREDKIMCWSIIPLLIRMAFVHVILIWGTNNTVTAGLTTEDIRHREIGSRLVLIARIFYAIFIWIAKLTVVEFLRRLIGKSWHKSYEIGARIMYGFLAITFIAVVVATLAECRPFDHYWQVVPDPGPRCREGLAQLITMGVCDIISDVALIAFPIPLVLMSSMSLKRKVSLVLLFLLSLILITITAFRVPSTIHFKGRQQYRSLLASCEILAASGVSNAVVIGSFIRDRGVKKAKFRRQSLAEDGGTLSKVPTRAMSMAQNHWGSDEDLGRELGISVHPDLRHSNIVDQPPRPAPFASSFANDVIEEEMPEKSDQTGIDRSWDFSRGSVSKPTVPEVPSDSPGPKELKVKNGKSPRFDLPDVEDEEDDVEPKSPSKMNFFDVGGLMGGSNVATRTRGSGHADTYETAAHTSLGLNVRPRGTSHAAADNGSWPNRRHTGFGTNNGGAGGRPEFDRQPHPRSEHAHSVSHEVQKQAVDAAPAEEGPESLSFVDVGGLLR